LKQDIEYDINKPWLTLDPWQKKYINTEGNCFLLCGRQSGKTTAMSIKFGKRAATRPNRVIMMNALTEKQAYNLFFKTLMYLEAVYPKMIKRKQWKPTKHRIYLTNGSVIMCYAAGLSGEGLRTFTLTDHAVDEAAPMSREFFIATSPMLSVTGGNRDYASTPRGKGGYYYECSDDKSLGKKIKKDWTRFYISAEECPRHDQEFLDSEKASMSELEYAQEYLAKFLDDLKRLYPDDIINKICKGKKRDHILKNRTYYLGSDIGGLGGSQNTFEIFDRINNDKIVHVESETTKNKLTTETTQRIIEFNTKYDLKKILVDDGGPGFGVFSELLTDDRTKRKVIAINNASRPLNRDETQSKRILKEDLYMHLLTLMHQGKIELLDDDEVRASLASVQYEYIRKKGQKTVFRIFGNYTHITEGIIRGVWPMIEKNLGIWIR